MHIIVCKASLRLPVVPTALCPTGLTPHPEPTVCAAHAQLAGCLASCTVWIHRPFWASGFMAASQEQEKRAGQGAGPRCQRRGSCSPTGQRQAGDLAVGRGCWVLPPAYRHVRRVSAGWSQPNHRDLTLPSPAALGCPLAPGG